MSAPARSTRPSPAKISRYGMAIALGGALIQLVLGIYYLAMAHSPEPHRLPVGLVATGQVREQITAQLEAKDRFTVEDYSDSDDLVRAIRHREAYGGVVMDGEKHTLYVASAASPAVANLLRATYTQAHQDQVDAHLADLAEAARPVPLDAVEQIASPPAVTDVVPLPEDDSSGSSLAFLIQALVLGGSIASISLGRLGKLTERSLARGVGHVALLLVYAALSAGVAMIAMTLFGVGVGESGPGGGGGADHLMLFSGLALASLAITSTIAAAVALIGPAGTLLGGLYFALGLVISGASIAPEMLPPAGRLVGQFLPPGAGATLVRDGLYFPDATNTGPLMVLGLFAGIGLIVLLVTNAVDYRRPFEKRQARLS